jgi:hypothetical protein
MRESDNKMEPLFCKRAGILSTFRVQKENVVDLS